MQRENVRGTGVRVTSNVQFQNPSKNYVGVACLSLVDSPASQHTTVDLFLLLIALTNCYSRL